MRLGVRSTFAVIALAISTSCSTAPRKLNVPSSAVPSDYFGMHIHRALAGTPWPGIPFGAWRLWDAEVAWPNLEPSRGDWHFETLDRYVELARQHGTDILLPLALTPAWASSRPQEKSGYQPGNAAPPRDLEAWSRYVRKVASRYKGVIRNYEIWNEPTDKNAYTGTPEQMLELAALAYPIIKDVDPGATVVSPAPSEDAGLKWIDEYFRLGGGKYADVIGFHFYLGDAPPERLLDVVDAVKAVTKKYSLDSKPLWNTEFGWYKPKSFDDQTAAAYVVRSYALGWAAGIARTYWYAWDNTGWATLHMTRADHATPTMAAEALGNVSRWLTSARLLFADRDGQGTWTTEWKTASGTLFRIVWNPEHTEVLAPDPQFGYRAEISTCKEARGHSSVEAGPVPLALSQRPLCAPGVLAGSRHE